MPDPKPLLGKNLAEAVYRVAQRGEEFARLVRSMQESKRRLIEGMHEARRGGVDNATLRALLPGMTDAAVEDLMAEGKPARVTKSKGKK